ncbi:SAF domain-containing protein [Nocardioides sp. Bht2]|uniref:SAF domain-containing protein n=1 Tax=Nocardioides sp. Bht2 TaxID=3392297 RepID=UPI0039B45962
MPTPPIAPLRDRLKRAGQRARRRVLRHRRPLVALCLAGAVASGLQAVAPPAPRTVSLTVAAHGLPAGHRLTATDLTTVQAPDELAPDGALTASAALGRTLTGPLRRGEPLTDARVVAGSLLAGFPGAVALPVRLPDAGVVALLRPGDRVDLIATQPTDGSVTQVATAVPVITVPQPDQGVTGALVVLAVSAADARQIARAAASMYLTATISR